ncbi:hypothetical protein [Agrobacterium rubi]|uniref:Uncharacterized protein n=1 Tax=Agrobacterium rubi TaxID=28099 RepID=A0ABX2JAY3_9HYPH|nr:hypothetical protein [Agrobacterium rubi]NTE89016.1 hypothetical protein [Agrobacterium rubi]NTF04844.1 hypothetical protein [Agrobacterium rubi]NTF39405.1 hypothetical protein [Agrobacterium rubi]
MKLSAETCARERPQRQPVAKEQPELRKRDFLRTLTRSSPYIAGSGSDLFVMLAVFCWRS